MMLEAELKAYAGEFALVIKKLEDVGAVLISKRIERDTYFSHPTRNFAETDEALRLREITGLPPEDSSLSSYELTFKGPKLDPASKSREEYTVKLSESDEAKQILVKLGCESVSSVRKVRTMYNYHDYTICLDEVDGLGNFIEIERILDSEADLDRTREAMIKIIKDLFGLERFERRSYLELLLDKTVYTP